ncbi:(dimethylallyl)adenosine tRNA methylthiotransferase [Bordetella ansorpii]|uniref:tRNA-2-methylthio-N(6)-dimethylallyladenosine synthase n=1 Tax=Bordetella ansorpii TaxID=288768 RepID=A0A157S5P0_9BORD|nr:tRNA (N6-isopentenyl adenosine(37)-C2)-methylthiotransferase MiaB [Bordetella ansorpii]SAI65717.1 (dimethylallyl)adenosine tRNA methylthiotransferase [Bordetella ansorpii]
MQETTLKRAPAPAGARAASPDGAPRKLYIRTFGCQMNEYDSDKMADVLRDDQGLELTDSPEEADVILFNTCSVREKAQEKVFSDLGRVQHLKKLNPRLVIGVGGCVASQEGEAIVKRAPYVDVVFGPQTLHRLPELIARRRAQGRSQVDISFPEIEKFDAMPPPRVDGATAFVSIMEGCSKYCSFCVVPYTRGDEVSRPFDDVLVEVADLADQGVKEVTLLGQNVNAYRGAMGDSGEIADFATLLEYVHEIPGIERIRYTTSHPKEMTQRMVDAYAHLPKLVSFLHLPVQAGSDRVLAAMKRGYTALEFKSVVRKLRAARPGLTLSSDFIVGFPGETEEDFEKTMKLIADVGFDTSFSFVYSRRPGTPAADLHDDTPQDVKLRRLQRLQALINEQAAAIANGMVGTRQRVLVEGESRRDARELMGRTENNRIVNFAAPARLIGQMVDVEITHANTNTLRGRVATGSPDGSGSHCATQQASARITAGQDTE